MAKFDAQAKAELIARQQEALALAQSFDPEPEVNPLQAQLDAALQQVQALQGQVSGLQTQVADLTEANETLQEGNEALAAKLQAARVAADATVQALA